MNCENTYSPTKAGAFQCGETLNFVRQNDRKSWTNLSTEEKLHSLSDYEAYWLKIEYDLTNDSQEARNASEESFLTLAPLLPKLIEKQPNSSAAHAIKDILRNTEHLAPEDRTMILVELILGNDLISKTVRDKLVELNSQNQNDEIQIQISTEVQDFARKLDVNLHLEKDPKIARPGAIIREIEQKSEKLRKLILKTEIVEDKSYVLAVRDIFRDELKIREPQKKARTRKPYLKPLTNLEGFLRASADPINMRILETFTPGNMRRHEDVKSELLNLEGRGMFALQDYNLLYAFESNKKDLFGFIGYKKGAGETLWGFQKEHSALILQTHIALLARAYAETDAEPGKFITLRILDLCDDLQFARKKGSHKRETKRRVLKVLECLAQLQMKIMYVPPPQEKSHLFSGPIWLHGLTHETADSGNGRLQWEPETFSYAPGLYFAFKEWRNYTRNVAYIGEGLLKLHANNDKWAIHGGGYLALLSRMNGYQKQKLSVKTLLEKTGLIAASGKFHKTSEMEEKLIHALETLEKVGVIESWNWLEDKNDEEAFASKLVSETLFNQQIEIEYPNALRQIEEKLTDRKASYKEKSQKKTKKSADH